MQVYEFRIGEKYFVAYGYGVKKGASLSVHEYFPDRGYHEKTTGVFPGCLRFMPAAEKIWEGELTPLQIKAKYGPTGDT